MKLKFQVDKAVFVLLIQNSILNVSIDNSRTTVPTKCVMP